MKEYYIAQYPASTKSHPAPLFEIEGTDLEAMRVEARARNKKLGQSGHVILQALYVEKEILPWTLENVAKGQGRAARKARKHLRSGKHTGKETWSNATGKWE